MMKETLTLWLAPLPPSGRVPLPTSGRSHSSNAKLQGRGRVLCCKRVHQSTSSRIEKGAKTR